MRDESDEMGEYEETLRDLRPSYAPDYSTIYSQSASTPSTVRSVSREQVDRYSASANLVTKPSDMGYLTVEQKTSIDLHPAPMNQALFGNYLIEKQEQ